MVIFQDILILRWEFQNSLELTYYGISITLIFQEILPNFGDVGTFHYRRGFEITSIFHWAEAKAARENKSEMYL